MAAGAFEEVVYYAGDEKFVLVFLDVDEGFVGVHHLLQVYVAVDIVSEGGIGVEVAVEVCHSVLGDVLVQADELCAEDASGEVATIGDKVYGGAETRLQLCERLADFCEMLMSERLVDAQVTGAPREMGGCSGLHACAG